MAGFEGLDAKPESVDDDSKEVKLERRDSADDDYGMGTIHVGVKDEPAASGSTSPSEHSTKPLAGRDSASPHVKSDMSIDSPKENDEHEEKIGAEIAVKMEPGQPPKLARSSSQKVVARVAPLFDHFPDKTEEAKESFQVMQSCTYANKFLGYTEHAMECDCSEEWDPSTKQNSACGEDSDCINRATKMECVGDCGCGSACQNQRFQQREYANVSVIKTDKKGYGLRTDSDLRANDFIFEYIGEVINEASFRRRMIQYDDEGIKHFYFMSLSKGEFVDATKRGNLGRFCNHSCNPNCYVDKWVVGDKLRMGIFAERKIKAGEELVFNYNVDRYGADPQPCYCGEQNCTGFIGGKTQTERATKLSNATIEALGIDDGDGWDTAVAKRPRKKKTGEDDEEYVDSVQPKALDADGVTKVMAALMQCKEKWIAVKLLSRIQQCDDEQVRNRVVKMHGYQILNSQLAAWKEDFNVVLQVLDILHKFPRITRNKIIDSKIESTVQPLTSCGDERVEKQAATLIDIWSTLEVGYRIPRKKRILNEDSTISTPRKQDRFERRESREERKRSKSQSRSRSRSRSPPRGPAVPAGPRASLPQRSSFYSGPPRPPPPFRRPFNPLPKGWFSAEADGKTYYYSANGGTTWTRPTMPAPEPPPPPKPESKDKALQNIIDSIMNAKEQTPKEKTTTPDASHTPVSKETKEKRKEEKWRSYDEEKKKKLYENTLFPHIQHVMGKFKAKLPRDDLKRFGKEIAKKLVSSDFKAGRVEDPTKISEKQEKKVKKYCKDFFDKAVVKHRAHEKKKAEKRDKPQESKDGGTPPGSPKRQLDASPDVKKEADSDDEGDIKMSDDEDEKVDKNSSPVSPETHGTNGERLKRKREADDGDEDADFDEGSQSPSKKVKAESPPPPPPPPPPADTSADASAATSPREYSNHDEGAFTSKTMADVLASAQQDTGDDNDTPMEGAAGGRNGTTKSSAEKANGGATNGFHVSTRPAPHSPSTPANDESNRGVDFEYEERRRDSRMDLGIETSAG